MRFHISLENYFRDLIYPFSGYVDIKIPLDREYFPVVGMQACNEVVQTNFGQRPFLYNVEKDFRRARFHTKRSFNKVQLPPEKVLWMNDAVANWLVHLGYADVTQAFIDQTHVKINCDPEYMRKRNEAIQIIKNGQISENLDDILETFDSTFSKPEFKALVVLLKVQAFIEDMMKVVEVSLGFRIQPSSSDVRLKADSCTKNRISLI